MRSAPPRSSSASSPGTRLMSTIVFTDARRSLSMAITIEERFPVRAPIDRVWQYLADPRQVVLCLPGAELVGEDGENSYLGRVKIKVGPIVASYNGKATIVELNEAEHLVRMVGEGR